MNKHVTHFGRCALAVTFPGCCRYGIASRLHPETAAQSLDRRLLE